MWTLFYSTHMELLDDLMGGFVQPLLHTDLRLLLQVHGIGCTRLSLYFGVLRQLQLFKALKLCDPINTHMYTLTLPTSYSKLGVEPKMFVFILN